MGSYGVYRGRALSFENARSRLDRSPPHIIESPLLPQPYTHHTKTRHKEAPDNLCLSLIWSLFEGGVVLSSTKTSSQAAVDLEVVVPGGGPAIPA